MFSKIFYCIGKYLGGALLEKYGYGDRYLNFVEYRIIKYLRKMPYLGPKLFGEEEPDWLRDKYGQEHADSFTERVRNLAEEDRKKITVLPDDPDQNNPKPIPSIRSVLDEAMKEMGADDKGDINGEAKTEDKSN